MQSITLREKGRSRAIWLALIAMTFGGAAIAEPLPTPNDAPLRMENHGAVQEGPVGGPAMLWLDEATRARGDIASSGSAEATIFDQPNDSGFGWFMKSDDTLGFGTWAMRMVLDNGWQPGDSFSSYEALIFHSASDAPSLGGADFMIELWDGDPMGIMETVCSIGGIPAPIPGTVGIIADVPHGALIRARVELAEKVTYDCDRVWMVMTMLSGCRATWRLAGSPGNVFDPAAAPSLGSSNGIWLLWPCEAFAACDTANGNNSGFCCGSPETLCDAVADPQDCVGPQPGGDMATSIAAMFCGAGVVDSFFADFGLPDTERSYVASLFASTVTTMSVVPVSVDALPGAGGLPADVISLSGNELILAAGGHDVWLEIRLGDWDPNEEGTKLAGYSAKFRVAQSFTSGAQGELTANVGPGPCGECSDNSAPCFGDDECAIGTCSGSGDPCRASTFHFDCPSGETCIGPASCEPRSDGNDFCEAALGVGAVCSPTGYVSGTGTCGWGYVDRSDPTWALRDAGATITVLDFSNPLLAIRLAGVIVDGPPDDPDPFPPEGMYGATLAITVPSDAKGTFTIALAPYPESSMSGSPGPLIPLLGTVPATITIQTGRCRFNLQDIDSGGDGCIDFNQTAASCAQQPGHTSFAANVTCDDLPSSCAALDDCSGNGTCVAPDVCECHPGWTGDDCSTFSCATLNDCSGNGTCAGPNLCACDPGWTGDDCSAEVKGRVSLVAIGATGNHRRNNGEIIVLPGQAVFIEIQLSDWDRDLDGVPGLSEYQVTMTSSSYSSGTSGTLAPFTPPCASTDCTVAVHDTSQCDTDATCIAGVIDQDDPSHPFADVAGLQEVDRSSPDYRFWAASTDVAVSDSGAPRHAGFIALEVPPDAAGTFTVRVSELSTETFLLDEAGSSLESLVFSPLKITVVASEDDMFVRKNRFLTISTGRRDRSAAIRVTLANLGEGFDIHNGTTMWVSEPQKLSANTSNGVNHPVGATEDFLWIATLKCEPTFENWSEFSKPIHVFHELIIPNSTYEFQSVDSLLDPALIDDLPVPFTVTTPRWGDVASAFDQEKSFWLPPSTDTSVPTVIADVLALIQGFVGSPGASEKVRWDLMGLETGVIDGSIEIRDILAGIAAFSGLSYPFPTPNESPCP